MELWFFYALIGSIAIGINSYLVKLIADRKIDGSVITLFQGFAYFTIGIIESIIRGYDLDLLLSFHPAILISAVIAIVIFLNLRFRVRALKYLSSSEYYIGYRIMLTTILVIVGLLFLGESLSGLQIFSLVLGSTAIGFLFEEDKKLMHSRNWGRAIGFLGLSVIAGVLIQILGKMQGLSGFPFSLMLFIQGVVMLTISLMFDRKVLKVVAQKRSELPGIFIIALPATVCVYIAATFNLYAYEAGGSVSVVTKIYAYSLFIPIILSVVFSGEIVTYKKLFAFLLTIISLYYMI